MKNAQMSLAKGFFRTVPLNKKVRSWARTRGRNCSPSRAHPRRLLSWRTPSSGCGSGMTTLASLTAGTDALERLPGSHRLASRWCGSAAQRKEEMEVLFAVPIQLRTPAQRARLRELISASSQAWRRKRKKRRKMRTPRTSSLRGCARRRQRPEMPCIMAGMYLEDRCSGLIKARIVGYVAPRAVFPFSGLQAPHALHFGRYEPEVQLQWHVQSWFFWCFCTSRCFA